MSRETHRLPAYKIEIAESDLPTKSGTKRCEIGKHIRFDTHGLESYLFARWDPKVFDALLLAGAVEFSDRTCRRSASAWGREIALRLPVHDPDFWNARAVSDSLAETLNFLTGDRWRIHFHRRRIEEARRKDNQFDLPATVSAVMPFSDGLDSWSTATLKQHEIGHGLLRVRLGLRRPPRISGRTRQPAFSYVPYKVQLGDHPSKESAVRSRGFRFALISGIAAILARVEEIIVPESGQSVLAPAILGFGGSYPDYRSHPLFLNKMEQLLNVLFDSKVRYLIPRLWSTKGETLRAAVSVSECKTDWLETRSCWQKSRHISVGGSQRQCGICAACLLRRLSVHAADLEEPPDTYAWDNLSAAEFHGGASPLFAAHRITDALRRHAFDGIWHLNSFAFLAESPACVDTLNNSAVLLNGVLECSRIDVAKGQHSLLQSHREEWENFLVALGPSSFVTRWTQAI